jgi:ankyrin repeat protein
LPFILQLNENNFKIKNKGEFLLKNAKTIDDIYLGLCFLIVEGKEKLFINKLEELKELIDINNQIIDGNTFLIFATREGNKNIIKFLCENKCEMNLQNDKGNTALHYAIGNLFFDIVDILISYGAKEDILNCKGLRPWDCIDKYLE